MNKSENNPGAIFTEFYEKIDKVVPFIAEYKSERPDGNSSYLGINEHLVMEPGEVCKTFDSDLKIRIIVVSTCFGNVILFEKKSNSENSIVVVHYNRSVTSLLAILGAITVVGSKDMFKILGKDYKLTENIGYTLMNMKTEFLAD